MSRSNQTQTLTAPSQPETQVETGALRRPHAAVVERAESRRDGPESEWKHTAPPGASTPAPADAGEQKGRDFADVRTVVNITDADPQRAEATRQLLRSLAAQLGLRADNIEIRVDAEAERRTRQRAARGLVDDGVVYFDPKSYRPETREGRYLLGHEVAHVAQRNNKGRSPATELAIAKVVAEAEIEADRIGQSFVSGGAFALPRVALPVRVVAADSGVADVGDSAEVLNTEREKLDALVAEMHPAELARMIDLLSYGPLDWMITDEDVRKVLTILQTFNMVAARSLVAALPSKYRNRLLNNLDTDHYKSQRTQVLAVYWGSGKSELKKYSGELRSAFNTMDLRNLTLLEAAAAQYAIQSMDEADRRRLQQGKKQGEIEEILAFVPDPREEKGQLDEALKQERQLQDERAEAQKAYDSGERAKALHDIVSLIKKMIDRWWIYDRHEAQRQAQEDVFTILRMLTPYLRRRAELRAIADHLTFKISPSKEPGEALSKEPGEAVKYEVQFDYLDMLIRKVPVKALYVEGNLRRVFLTLVSFRPPFKNEELAEDLASTSFWVPVDSEDAYLAFLLVKAMPPHARQAFFDANGGSNWTLVMEKMSQQQRESESLNLYTGGKDEADKNALLTQLISDEVWGSQSVSRLDGLIRMAIAAGEHEFVFEQSRRREAYKKEWLKQTVEKFMLFDPNGKDNKGRPRDRYSPEILEGTAWYERGLVGLIHQYGIQGLDFVFSSDDVEVATKSIGGKGLNLVELQDMLGGSFMGVRFTELRNLGAEGKKAREKKSGVNFANVKWDTGKGVLEMNAPKLAFDAINYPIDDFKFQAGRGTLEQLAVILRYGVSKKPEPSVIDVHIGALTLNDVLLIWPDKMKGANKAEVGGIHINVQPSGIDTSKLPGPRGGAKIPVPVIGLPLGAAWNVFSGLLWNGLADKIGAPQVGITGSKSELAENLLKPATPLAFHFYFDSVRLNGVTTSGGHFVESIELKNLIIRGGGDALAYRMALVASQTRIRERLGSARDAFGRVASPEELNRVRQTIRSLEKQLTRTQAELDALSANEKEVARLEALQKQSPKSLRPEDRMRLRRLKAQLTGAVLDVGAVNIKGVAGVAGGELALTDVHGQGRSVNAPLSLLTNSDKIKSLITGEEGRPVITGEGKDQDQFTLDIGHLELPAIKLKGAIPKAEDARRDFERFKTKHEPWRKSHQEELARLERRAELAEEREALIADPGIVAMDDKQQKRFRQIERELDEIEAKAQLTIGRVVMDGATLNITGNERIAVGADELLVEDVRKGNLQIRQITGANVEVGVDVRDGVAGLDEWRKNLQRIGIKGESVIVTGVKNEEIGLDVDRATLMGIKEASLDVGTPNASARITTKLILVEGVRLRNFEDRLIKERDYWLAKAERKPEEQKRLEAAQKKLDALAELRKQIVEAEADLAKAKTPKQKLAAQNRRDRFQRQLDSWAEGLVAESLAVSDLDVDVLGLGDVLSEAYDPASALDNGVEVRGRGGSGGRRIFSGATGVNVGIPGLSGSKVSVGETAGRVTHSKAGTLLDNIHIDTIAGQGVDWRDGQRHVFSRGETRLQGIDVTAFIGEDQIVISKLDLGAIIADQLGYEDLSSGLSVVVESGGLGGVHITNLTIALPKGKDESAKITGKAVVDKLNDVKINALVNGIRAKGTLNGSNLTADFVTDRKRVFSIGELTLTGGEILQPGTANNIHVSFSKLKGAVTQEDLESGETKYTVSDVSLSDLTVGKSRWADGGKSIEINGQASLIGISLDAEVLQGKKEADGKPGKLKQLKIVRLKVAQINATNIHAHADAVPPDPRKPKDKGSKAKDITLDKGTIIDLEVTGIDLVKDISKMTGQVRVKDLIDIQKLRIAVGDAGKDQIVTALSVKTFGAEAKEEGMRGRELRATLFGPEKGQKLELGTIKETSGDFEGFGAKTGFSTGQITMSPIEISGDGSQVKVSDVEIKDLKLTSPTFTDGKGTDVKLDSAHATAVHIKNVVAKFGEVTDKDGNKSDGMTNLAITGLKFDFIEAKGFNYTGKTTISSKDSKTLTITADKAELTELVFESLSRDFNKRITKLNANLKKTSVTGFMGSFAETLAGKTSKTELFGNIEAGSMHAELTLTGTKANGEDWTSVDGLFELTDPAKGLGLTNMRVVHTEGGEKKVEVELLHPDVMGGLDLRGLNVKFAPNGTMYAEFSELAAENLRLKAGTTFVEIPIAKLKNAAVSIVGLAPGKAFDVLGATLKELELHGVQVSFEVERGKPPDASDEPKASEPWKLDALRGLDGTVWVHSHDTPEANIAVPIRGGVINFDDVRAKPVVGSFPIGIDKKGIYVEHIWKEYKYEEPNIPGSTTEIIETSGTLSGEPKYSIKLHGALDLKVFLESTLNDISPGTGSSKPPKPLTMTNDLSVEGDLNVGDGIIGTSKKNIVLTGKAVGKNRISISSTRLGASLVFEIPEFQASRSQFELIGKPGETGQINANVNLYVGGLGGRGRYSFVVTLTVVKGEVRDIKFGDVSIVSEAAMRAQPAPP